MPWSMDDEEGRSQKISRMQVLEDSVFTYSDVGSVDDNLPGVYVHSKKINFVLNYFEIEVLEFEDSMSKEIVIGLVKSNHSLNALPGECNSYSLHVKNCKVFLGQGSGKQITNRTLKPSDRFGCGVRLDHYNDHLHIEKIPVVHIFFTINGIEVDIIMTTPNTI